MKFSPLSYATARAAGLSPGRQGRERPAGGFTIIELMITLVVLAIIVTLAGPGLMSFVTQSRMTGQINELLADISYARSEAASRGVRVGICASTTSTATTPACSSANTDWTKGRFVFVDVDGDGKFDNNDFVLKAYPALTGGSVLVISQTSSTSPPALFEFRPYGGVFTASNALVGTQTAIGAVTGTTGVANAQISFKLCPSAGTSNVQGRQLAIAITGRPNVSKVGC